MNSHRLFFYAGAASLILVTTALRAPADITWTGDISSDPTTWTESTTGCYVSKLADGSITVDEGSDLFSYACSVGYTQNDQITGQITIDGTGSSWTNTRSIDIGDYCNGILTITGGGSVSSGDDDYIALAQGSNIGSELGSTGEVTINGDGSSWINHESLYVGHDGSGKMTVSGGGAVEVSGWANIGSNEGSSGQVIVDGAGTTWTSGRTLVVGQGGRGKFAVSGGASVMTSSTILGDYSSSQGIVTIDGAGSKWTNTGYIEVGGFGSGFLAIANGAAIEVYSRTWVGPSGSVFFAGGTLTTDGLSCGVDDLLGTGTIYTSGMISDFDLVFDAMHGVSQTIMVNELPGQNITVHLDTTRIGPMGAGFQGNGTMSVSDGVVLQSSSGTIGDYAGSSGIVTVGGAGSKWLNNSSLRIGYEGEGTLTVSDGGTVSNGIGVIGDYATGHVTVDGVGSTWTNREELNIGDYGSGTLVISNGGSVTSDVGRIGRYEGSTGQVTVDGVGSTWTNNDFLSVGLHGNATLTISGGATVSSKNAYIRGIPGMSSNVYVDGAGSAWTARRLVVGSGAGEGKLSITGGGVVNSSFDGGSMTPSTIGGWFDSPGHVIVDGVGSTWICNDMLYIGHYDQGTLTISAGGIVSNLGAVIGLGSTLAGTGTIAVDGAGSKWINGGDVALGEGVGSTITITDAGLMSVEGLLTINASIEGDTYINMSTGGMLALMGDADDSLTSFLDLIDGTDAIRYWDDDISDWADITGATNGVDYLLQYQSSGDLVGYTLLTVGGSIPDGDFDGDGDVDVADLMAIQRDGTPQDLAGWNANFGYGADAASAIAPVPEPGAFWLAIVGIILSRRR